jgi:hypothetical protein
MPVLVFNMNGLTVLEGILSSLPLATQHRLEIYREVIRSSNDSTVRTIMQVGPVLGVHEFLPHEINPMEFTGERIGGEQERLRHDRDGTSYLYEVTKRLRKLSTSDQLFLMDDYSTERNPVVCKVSPNCDSVCRGQVSLFEERLKPTTLYSIITPIARMNFPVITGWRNSMSGNPTIQGTALIHTPFEIIPNKDAEVILEMMEIKRTDPDYFVNLGYNYGLTGEVFKAVGNNEGFRELTQHLVELSRKIDEKQRQSR